MGYVIFYYIAVALSCVAMLFLISVLWRNRHANGVKAMILLITATFIWSFFSIFETFLPSLEAKQLFFKLGYIGLMLIPPAWLIFSVNYTAARDVIAGWRALPFFLIPLATLVIVWVPGWYSTIYSLHDHLVQSGPFTVITRDWSSVFWVTAAHNYVLLFTGSVLILWLMILKGRLYKGQALLLLIATVLPTAWNIVYVFNLIPLPQKDFSPVALAISALLVVLGMMRYNLFMVAPFARQFFFSNIKDALLVFDGQNRLVEANPAAEHILNLSKSDYGKRSEDLTFLTPVLTRLNSGTSGIIEVPVHVSGNERYYEVESIQMTDAKRYVVGNMVILRDVTERKLMQDQINAQDRLVSIGKLTAGVAHEINNPLAIIKGLTELLLDSDINEETKDDISIISDEVDRATVIVGNLLTFARKQHGEKRLVDVNEIVRKTVALREYELSCSNIKTVMNLSPDLPLTEGNPIQIRQVITNILINAEFFMTESKGSGTIKISTRQDDDMLSIEIKDDGPGIDEENLKRIFDPFFTTKQIGKGTGLGLSVCHGIVTEHGGDIKVVSKPGDGAAFIVTLPVAVY